MSFLIPIFLLLAAEELPAPKEVLSNDKNYVVTVQTMPSEVPLNKPFKLVIEIRDSQGSKALVDDISIKVDGGMPSHNHAMYTLPKMKKLSKGRFEVTGMLFHMPGVWLVTVDINSGFVTERAQYVVFI